MTTTPEPQDNSAPDAISARELSQFLEHAPEEASDIPIPLGSSVPPLSLAKDGGGILDLAVFLEQVIACSSTGCSVLHMLQAAGWILSGCLDRVSRDIERMETTQPEVIIQHMRRDADSLRGITALLERLCTPASSAAVMTYIAKHGLTEGAAGLSDYAASAKRLPRQIFVSDEILDQLGIDRDAYTQFLRKRVDLGG